MIWFKKYFFLVPILLIAFQLIIYLNIDFSPRYTPQSDKNSTLDTINLYLHTANLNPISPSILGFQNEYQFYLQNKDLTTYSVILNTSKDPLAQVTALQKLTKLANIKGNDIKFIDLSSSRPYATF